MVCLTAIGVASGGSRSAADGARAEGGGRKVACEERRCALRGSLPLGGLLGEDLLGPVERRVGGREADGG